MWQRACPEPHYVDSLVSQRCFAIVWHACIKNREFVICKSWLTQPLLELGSNIASKALNGEKKHFPVAVSLNGNEALLILQSERVRKGSVCS